MLSQVHSRVRSTGEARLRTDSHGRLVGIAAEVRRRYKMELVIGRKGGNAVPVTFISVTSRDPARSKKIPDSLDFGGSNSEVEVPLPCSAVLYRNWGRMGTKR
jgi:hypothetical protein